MLDANARRRLLLSFALIALAPLATAQCGYAWQPIAGFPPQSFTQQVYSLAQLPGDRLAVGGIFQISAGSPSNCVAVYDRATATWHPLGSGSSPNAIVWALAVLGNGDLVAGGAFTQAGGGLARGIARWNGAAWLPFGTGLDPAFGNRVETMLVLPNGDLVIGGVFTSVDGVPAANVARWNGSTWSAVGTPAGGVTALALAANGDLLAGGTSLQRWNGAAWTTLGTTNGPIYAIVEQGNGDIVIGGSFGQVNGTQQLFIARWDGTSWHALAQGLPFRVRDIATLPDGDLLVGGDFTSGGALGFQADFLARWNGASWSRIDPGTDSRVMCLARRDDSHIDVGGIFDTAGGLPSPLVATLATPCPASATPFGAGCAGTAGPVVLTAATLPWLGTTCETRATGIPANAFAAGILGVAPAAVPLSSLLPSPPGCFLLAVPDHVFVLIPAGGVATTRIVLPNAGPLLGFVTRQQVLPFTIGLGGVSAVTASNALILTVGAF